MQATFLTSFWVPPHARSVRGALEITADNAYRARLNGAPVGAAGVFSPHGPDEFTWSTVFEHAVQPRPGHNRLEVDVVNYFGRATDDNPAGVVFRLEARYSCPAQGCLQRDP